LRNLGIKKFLNPRIDDPVKTLKTVTPAEAGVQKYLNLQDSRSPPSRGQGYPCESRGGNDKIGK
jgi:hypothetical protein